MKGTILILMLAVAAWGMAQDGPIIAGEGVPNMSSITCDGLDCPFLTTTTHGMVQDELDAPLSGTISLSDGGWRESVLQEAERRVSTEDIDKRRELQVQEAIRLLKEKTRIAKRLTEINARLDALENDAEPEDNSVTIDWNPPFCVGNCLTP